MTKKISDLPYDIIKFKPGEYPDEIRNDNLNESNKMTKQDIKNIIQERPFGLDGISKALFEIENISSAFSLLSESEKSKFKSLIENKKKKFFKIIKKNLI